MNISNLEKDVILAPLTTYQIGGSADYFVTVHNQQELVEAVVTARRVGMPYFLLGAGANILVGDKGFRGLVIHNRASAVTRRGKRVIAESGVTVADLIAYTAAQELSGLEHFAGIPSSVGGALWQNLHFLSPDRQRTIFIEEVLWNASVLMPDNSVRLVDVEFFEFGYDDSILHHQEIIVLQATFELQPGSQAKILAQVQANLTWRTERQPQLAQFPSCGSVFKKIDQVGAGRLIDQVGLKGTRIGGAQISPQHANFLVNTGDATASDVLQLAKLAQHSVREQLGYELQMEIMLVGEF